ncbi:uncharacterized protein LOC121373868 [Gigantopelta aegis]|uniref:uncharacterized protein LOC121373868 n=1 Tax=Gigantopelta aegis TaxID=1735272 RepID=UPI001B887B24|nr:uncharacterized protein LOC121373868 [Gigantopelta aegis]
MLDFRRARMSPVLLSLFVCLFCRQFYGRYCQYTHNLRACGSVKHGAWLKSNCDLCRCYNGRIMCIQKAYNNCDIKKHGNDLDPLDPSNNIYIFQDDQENELYDDDYFAESAASRKFPIMLAVVIACILGLIV